MSLNRNIALTGIPRSGTTLACYLLNQCDNTLALHEPLRPSEYFGLPREMVIEEIIQFFETSRRNALEHATALTKQFKGQVPMNPVQEIHPWRLWAMRILRPGFRRQPKGARARIRVDKALDADFTLVVKQPPFFTAMLAELVEHLRCVAIIRNPLATLLSWNSLVFPISQGHSPTAEGFDAALKQRLANVPDAHMRQILLLEWFYTQYAAHLPEEHLVRYEDMIASNGNTLLETIGLSCSLKEELSTLNYNKLYPVQLVDTLFDRLMSFDDLTLWQYYTREDAEHVYRVIGKAR